MAKLSLSIIPEIKKVVLDYGCPKEKDGLPKKHDLKKGARERKKGVTMSEKKRRG